jgi:hypothetical protein
MLKESGFTVYNSTWKTADHDQTLLFIPHATVSFFVLMARFDLHPLQKSIQVSRFLPSAHT